MWIRSRPKCNNSMPLFQVMCRVAKISPMDYWEKPLVEFREGKLRLETCLFKDRTATSGVTARSPIRSTWTSREIRPKSSPREPRSRTLMGPRRLTHLKSWEVSLSPIQAASTQPRPPWWRWSRTRPSPTTLHSRWSNPTCRVAARRDQRPKSPSSQISRWTSRPPRSLENKGRDLNCLGETSSNSSMSRMKRSPSSLNSNRGLEPRKWSLQRQTTRMTRTWTEWTFSRTITLSSSTWDSRTRAIDYNTRASDDSIMITFIN